MVISLKRKTPPLTVEQLAGAALRPNGQAKLNQLLRINGITGRRDSLTELQQKILSAALSLVPTSGRPAASQPVYKMKMNDFLLLCDIEQQDAYISLVGEIEKLSRKGLWLHDEVNQRLTRTLWFQAIEFAGREITFQFTAGILAVIAAVKSEEIERQLVKGIQYKGKHTMAVYEIIMAGKAGEITEYSIPELMEKLSLENTRYSYGQLKLRVLEPALQEIYDCDDAIYVRFGPAFSGRRAEGIRFEVTTGAAATELRSREPEFKFAPPVGKAKATAAESREGE